MWRIGSKKALISQSEVKPQYDMMLKVMKALGVRLHATAA